MRALWTWQAEAVLCLSLDGTPAPPTQRRLLALAAALRGRPGLCEVVPGLHSLTLCLTPQAALDPPAREALEAAARQAWTRARPAREALRQRELPVHYGGDDGPDLAEAAAQLGLSPAQLIEAHAAPQYEVACLGFLPGFPYLLGLPAALALPRRASPRLRVPAGSVGIGGAQTGVYPCEAPGGWQLIGRTDVRLFDPAAASPTWLLPGDRLRFVPA